MNSNYEKDLELEIDRELKNLSELRAPSTLAARVMAAIQTPAHAPWYRRSWQAWPVWVQYLSLGTMLALFAAVGFELWKLQQYAAMSRPAHEVAGWFAVAGALWNAVSAVFSALVFVVKQFGTGIIIGCLAGLALAWATCLGLGTFWLRLAFSRRQL